MHLERARHLLELLVGEVRDRRLRDRDERHLVRDDHDREGELVRLLHDRYGHRREAESDSEPEAGEPVLGQPPQVGALGRRHLADAETGGEEELPSLEELGRVCELRDVQPADLVAKPLGAGRDREPQAGKLGDALHGEHVLFRRHVQDATPFCAAEQPGTRDSWTRGPKGGPVGPALRISDLPGPCRPWRCRGRSCTRRRGRPSPS